jgi:hypothetical protein
MAYLVSESRWTILLIVPLLTVPRGKEPVDFMCRIGRVEVYKITSGKSCTVITELKI